MIESLVSINENNVITMKSNVIWIADLSSVLVMWENTIHICDF